MKDFLLALSTALILGAIACAISLEMKPRYTSGRFSSEYIEGYKNNQLIKDLTERVKLLEEKVK